jgi:FdhD protein
MDSIAQTKSFSIKRSGDHEWVSDRVASEEPLEIRLDGHPVAVLMRTPGQDEDLVKGFLITESILTTLASIRKWEPRPDENRALVFLHDEAQIDLGRLTRHLFSSSSCGLCGKATLDAVFALAPPVPKRLEVADAVLCEAPAKLRAAQRTFEATGGLHGAGLFAADGSLLVLREDIGRHNAVDKVIGHSIQQGLPLTECFLLVSGRVSFEIMQKSLVARIPMVAAISAPSSLAVEFAQASGQTLIGFLRPPTFNRYVG